MFWLKSCRKCGGDLTDERDRYGYYVFCVRCGYYLSDEQMAILQGPSRPQVADHMPPKGRVLVG